MRGPDQPADQDRPMDQLERDLSRILREPPATSRVDLLDARVQRLAARAVADADAGTGGRRAAWRRGLSAFGTLATTLVAVAVIVVALAGGRADGPAAGSPGPIGVASPSPIPGASESAPSPTPSAAPGESAAPSDAGPATPSASASASSPASSAPEPTPAVPPLVTPKPTPKPTPDPRPEPTPVIYTASGRLGQPVTSHGLTLTMARTDVPTSVGDVCAAHDRETWAYTVHLAWPAPASSFEPWVSVGSTPFYVVWWEPAYKVNADVVTVVCHLPGEGETVHVEVADGVDLVRWTVRP